LCQDAEVTAVPSVPDALLADLDRLRFLPNGSDRNTVLHRVGTYPPGYHDALRRIRRDGPGHLRGVALEALAHAAGEAGLSAADIATIERLIASKTATDRVQGIDACWNRWICVPGGDRAGIIEQLGLTAPRPVTFALGASVIEGQTHGGECDLVFVTPQINGWTAVVGTWCDPVDDERHAEVRAAVESLSGRFGEAHAFYFGSQGDGSAWLIARAGATIRRFSDMSAHLAYGEPLHIEREHLARVGLAGSPERYLDSVDPDIQNAMFRFTSRCTARAVAEALSLNVVWWQPSRDLDVSGQGVLAAIPGAVHTLVPPGAFEI
jgi:hypothetical protein